MVASKDQDILTEQLVTVIEQFSYYKTLTAGICIGVW